MNRNFPAFIDLGMTLLRDRGLPWELHVDEGGRAKPGSGWNLTKMVGGVQSALYLRNLGTDEAALRVRGESLSVQDRATLKECALSASWQDLIKAAVVEQLFVRKNSTRHVVLSIVRPLRVLATVAFDKEPWRLMPEDILLAIQIARQIQKCGKLADLILGVTKIVFDQYLLVEFGPLYPAVANARTAMEGRSREKYLRSPDSIRHGLEERKRSELLPDKRAFWELVRIVITEQPATFVDQLRFAAIRLMIVTGFRIGEAMLLPADWRIEKAHIAPGGRKPSDLGGIDRSMLIRYFAEKQHTEGGSSLTLRSSHQFVPRMFEDFLEETLDRVKTATEPLRRTVSAQASSGRLLPWFASHELVPMLHLYPYLTGNPLWMKLSDQERDHWIRICREKLNGEGFDSVFDLQSRGTLTSSREIAHSAYTYFSRLRRSAEEQGIMLVRESNGRIVGKNQKLAWHASFLRIDELEAFLNTNIPTKISDTEPLRLEGGTLPTADLLFLYPKRSLGEERGGDPCDIRRYMSIGRPTPQLLNVSLGGREAGESLFARYGRNETDRTLTLTSHMFRHLQSNELFRLGIADTILTKRFNRRSVAQSYEYDHRTLAEDLDAVEIPSDVELILGEKTATVYKMIKAGHASGPIIDEFKRIQQVEGEEEALSYLRAEADGFHATPYGICVSSFTVSPCPKHLQCFDGCRHLTSSNDPRAQASLKKLEIKLVAAVDDIESREAPGLGRSNQLEHARRMLNGVRAAMATIPGDAIFPDGQDYSDGHP